MKRKIDSCGITKKTFSYLKENIKTQPIDEIKENFNFNDIRESGYKLPRSKSGRKDHSLQRKKPIRYLNTKEGCRIKGKIERDHENHLQNTISFILPSVVSKNLEETQPKLCFDRTKNKTNSSKTNTFSSQQKCFSQQKQDFQSSSWQLQEAVLEHIQVIWESTLKIQLRALFEEQMLAIQNIIKKIILTITNPKLQEQSNMTLKFASLNQNQSDNLISFRNSTGINSTNLKGDNVNCLEGEQSGGIELKKIMYILEDRQKPLKRIELQNFHTQNIERDTPPQSSTAVSCENHSLHDLTNFSINTKSKQHDFLKNCSASEPTAFFNGEEDKANNNYSNNRVFLKNIVKKGKAVGMSLSGAIHCEKNSMDSSSSQKKVMSGDLSCNSLKDTSAIKDKYGLDEQELSQESDQTMETEVSKVNLNHLKTQKTIGQGSNQPKRVVLNQIIQMLNVKYNKTIKLEPRHT